MYKPPENGSKPVTWYPECTMALLPSRWLEPGRAMVVVVGLVAAATSGVFANGYVYDDEAIIVTSDFIHDARNLPALLTHPSSVAFSFYRGGTSPLDTFRPLTIATFVWDAALSGRAPWGYHLTNLLLHLGCVLLVWRLARRLLPAAYERFAPAAALWFGLTPLPSGAHVWISGRYDALSTLLGLSAVLTWASARDGNGSRAPRLVASAFAFLLALLSKETVVMIVPALVLWPTARSRGRSLMRELAHRVAACWPFLLGLLCYLPLRLRALGGAHTHRDADQLLLAVSRVPVLLLDALSQALVPTRTYVRMLTEEYARLSSWQLALGALAVAALGLATLWAARRWPLPAWSLLWFSLPVAPAALITTVYWPGFGRYLYLASAGLSVGIAWGLAVLCERFPRRRAVVLSIAGAYLVGLAVVLVGYVATYRDPIALYENIIAKRPDLAWGYGGLAAHYATRLKRLDHVAELYAKAEKLDPSRFDYARGLADTYWLLERPEDARRVAERAQERFGHVDELHFIQARTLYARNPGRAVEHLLTCLGLAPAHPGCQRALHELLAHPTLGARYRALLADRLAQLPPDALPQVRALLAK